MNDSVPERLRAPALAMIRQALGSAAKVDERGGTTATYDLAILRDGAKPIRFRLRVWDPSGQDKLSPQDVWIMASASRDDLRRLRQREQNYIALNGSVRLVRDWLLLDRVDLEPRQLLAALPKRANPFTDRNSLIARTLLSHPGRAWGIRELANESGVALGTASQVVRALTVMGAVQFRQSGKFAQVRADKPALLRRWFAAYTWERNERVAFGAPVGDVSRFMRRLPALLKDRRWALTLQAGASLVAPHAAWERVHAYVDVESSEDLLRIGDEHGWTPAEDGRLVLMRPYYRDSVWHGSRVIDRLPVVSDVQLTLDLWHYPLRGREQAEHILATRAENG